MLQWSRWYLFPYRQAPLGSDREDLSWYPMDFGGVRVPPSSLQNARQAAGLGRSRFSGMFLTSFTSLAWPMQSSLNSQFEMTTTNVEVSPEGNVFIVRTESLCEGVVWLLLSLQHFAHKAFCTFKHILFDNVEFDLLFFLIDAWPPCSPSCLFFFA